MQEDISLSFSLSSSLSLSFPFDDCITNEYYDEDYMKINEPSLFTFNMEMNDNNFTQEYKEQDRITTQLQHATNKALGNWELEEDQKLEELTKKYNRNWTKISKILKTKTPRQCAYRHDKFYLGEANQINVEFKRIEDMKLIELVRETNFDWVIIQKTMMNFTINQLKHRFHNVLLPRLSRKCSNRRRPILQSTVAKSPTSTFPETCLMINEDNHQLNNENKQEEINRLVALYSKLLDTCAFNINNMTHEHQHQHQHEDHIKSEDSYNSTLLTITNNDHLPSRQEHHLQYNHINRLSSYTKRLKAVFHILLNENYKKDTVIHSKELSLFNSKLLEKQRKMFLLAETLMTTIDNNLQSSSSLSMSTLINLVHTQERLIYLGKLNIKMYRRIIQCIIRKE